MLFVVVFSVFVLFCFCFCGGGGGGGVVVFVIVVVVVLEWSQSNKKRSNLVHIKSALSSFCARCWLVKLVYLVSEEVVAGTEIPEDGEEGD